MTPAQRIIQYCLHEGGPIKKHPFNVNSDTITEIRTLLSPLGLGLVDTKDYIEVVLSSEVNMEIDTQKINELKIELSESALQSLTIVLYRPGVTKPEMDFVRGVDSVRSIKSLLTRGLIYKNSEKNKNTYYPTTETLKFLDLSSVENLPNFHEINAKLTELISG